MNNIVTMLIWFVIGAVAGWTVSFIERKFRKSKQVEITSVEDELIKAYLQECMKDLKKGLEDWKHVH